MYICIRVCVLYHYIISSVKISMDHWNKYIPLPNRNFAKVNSPLSSVQCAEKARNHKKSVFIIMNISYNVHCT